MKKIYKIPRFWLIILTVFPVHFQGRGKYVKMEKISLEEIETVRQMMTQSAGKYWQTQNPGKEKPLELKILMDYALETMESHRVDNQQDFLSYFKELINRLFYPAANINLTFRAIHVIK